MCPQTPTTLAPPPRPLSPTLANRRPPLVHLYLSSPFPLPLHQKYLPFEEWERKTKTRKGKRIVFYFFDTPKGQELSADNIHRPLQRDGWVSRQVWGLERSDSLGEAMARSTRQFHCVTLRTCYVLCFGICRIGFRQAISVNDKLLAL